MSDRNPASAEQNAGSFGEERWSSWIFVALTAGVVLLAYLPAFNNGFISDDYVNLQRIQEWRRDPLYLYSIPPENFRTASYACLALLKTGFGYRPEFFYGFTIFLHLANVLMLAKLLELATGSVATARLAALLFAAIQNPQEAVMWINGMHESLQGAFGLATLIAWIRGRYRWCAIFYIAALFSKESAPVFLLLLPLVESGRSRQFEFRKELLYLLVPTVLFLVLYYFTAPANHFLTHKFYALHPRALWVWVNSLHRLAFPSVYLAVALSIITKTPRLVETSRLPLAWTALSLLPYIFLTYQTHVPSRHLYLASMGVAWLLSLLVGTMGSCAARRSFVIAFVTLNISYLWLVKDDQYQERAASTNELIRELSARPPERVQLVDFPQNPWIAQGTALLVPGWRRDLILVNASDEECPKCPKLVWDSGLRRYLSLP